MILVSARVLDYLMDNLVCVVSLCVRASIFPRKSPSDLIPSTLVIAMHATAAC